MDFKKHVAYTISKTAGVEEDFIYNLIEIPPDKKMGDLAFPCFQLSKTMRKAPNIIASDLAGSIEKDSIIDRVEAVGGYLNFFLNQSNYIGSILEEVLANPGKYGSSDIGKGKTVVVEFSSPNIAKPFHVGHLCSTVIGNSIEKIYAFLGYKTVKINHLGDWGTQFGKLISAYKHWGDKDAIKKDAIKELLRIYVKFHEEAQNNPELEEEGRMYFKKLEDGDAEAQQLWQEFRDLSLKEFKSVYDMLNITFDSFAGEAFYQDKMDAVVEMLENKGLLEESMGARVVNLERYNMPPCLILKSDGATIYATRDLAAALYRKKTYDFDKCLYVVGTPQALHFKQIFKVLELAGFEWHKNCKHIGFGLVKFPDRKLSTRSGDVILLEDLLREAINKTTNVIEQNNPSLENKEDIAKKVGIGAVIYTFLKNSRERDIVFSWDDMLDFEGESAPYVQYTYVRGRSILRKAGEISGNIDYSKLQTQDEFDLAKLIEGFKGSVLEAAEKNEPSVVTRHVTTLARSFNKFYNTCPIISAEQEIKNARLKLVEAVCSVLESGFGLLGIQMPERM